MHSDGAVDYVMKYVTKPGTAYTQEAGEALKGTRMYSLFGAWHSLGLMDGRLSYTCPECGCEEWISYDFQIRRRGAG
jgi:hypothetical protein